MKPPRPRIVKKHLKWVWERQKWTPYHRITWQEGGKRKERAVKLEWGGDAQKLDALYWACEAGRHEKQKAAARYTWSKLILAWKTDPRVRVAASTRKSYERDMKQIEAKNGDKDPRHLTRAQVRAIHTSLSATPRKADKMLSTISLLWNYGARKLDWPLGPNPAAGIDKFGKQTEFEPWPQWLLEADAPPDVRTAIELIYGTGQRPNAALSMLWEHFDGPYMQVLDEKARTRYEIAAPARLLSYLGTIHRQGEYVLAKTLREPLGYNAAQKRFAAWRKGIGAKAATYQLHGLRKNAIISLAESGATDSEIQAITNQSSEMVEYYRKRANRKRMSEAAQRRRT